MCLVNRQTVKLESVDAFKVFTFNSNNELQSCFNSTFVEGLIYKPNCLISVDKPEKHFFAFEKEKDAMRIAFDGTKTWDLVNSNLIVLPVTLFDVEIKGHYQVPSDDEQCLDGYFPAFMAKRITVHVENENYLEAWNRKVVEKYFADNNYRMTRIEKQAFESVIRKTA